MIKKRSPRESLSIIVCFVACKDENEAVNIAKALLKKKLCACVNIIKDMRSLYVWEGKLCDDREALMVIKTVDKKFNALETEVKKLHSYDVPEIIALPVKDVSEPYLKWVVESAG